jgi:excisionase family DNA binding protein
VGQASQILNVHPNTLRKWSDQGMIPHFRIGHRRDRRFALDDLSDFLERYDNEGDGTQANGRGH